MTTVEPQTSPEANSNSNDGISAEMEHLKKSFSQLRTDLTSLVGSALGAGKTGAHVVKEHATAAVDGVKHKVSDLKDKGVETEKAIEQKIADHPLASVVIAFGVGFMLARIITRKL
jgi:ElaB/YqjD/DUF883 family membrane-anchored ribosome-binding protein